MLSYAGVSLLLETEEHAEFVAALHDIGINLDTSNYGYTANLNLPMMPQLPVDGPIRINTLYWPCDASRCGIFHSLVTGARLELIKDALGATNTFADLVMSSSSQNTITASLKMLPPRVIHDTGSGDATKTLYLITLVDKRFSWRYKATTIAGQPATWGELYSVIGGLLGSTITAETVASAYGTPSTRWINYYSPLSTVLDSAAMVVGQRVAVNLDGTVNVYNPATSIAASELQYENYRTVIGGKVDYEDIQRAVPSSVTVVFTNSFGGVILPNPYSVNKTLASLAIADYGTATGVSNETKVLYSDLIYDGSNSSACDALATQLATDWYKWQLANLDVTLAGICDWTPTGLEDAIEWHHQLGGNQTTRIIRKPFQELEVVGNYMTQTSATDSSPPCRPVWYTEYHHLDNLQVAVGDTLPPGALLGYVANLGYDEGGPHSHFSLGDGSDFLNTVDYAVVGQSLDIDSWLPWPKTGTRDPFVPGPLYYPPVFEGVVDQAAAIGYIRSVFAPWLPYSGFIQRYGSSQHKGGDYYAVDVAREDGLSMAGQPIYLAIGSPAIESTVVYAQEINPEVHSMVIVRHRPCCCEGPWKRVVKCATILPGDIENDFVVGSVVDGVTLELGDPILIKDQLHAYENRLGRVNTFGPPTYLEDADTGNKYVGAVVTVKQGVVNQNSIWMCTNNPSVYLGLTPLNWTKIFPIPRFFAKLTSTPDGGNTWNWEEVGLDETGEWVTLSASTGASAVPSTIDGEVFAQPPYVDQIVFMSESKTRDGSGNWQYEFMPIPAVTVFQVNGAAGGGGYPATLQKWTGSGFANDTYTTSQLIEVNDNFIPEDTYVIAFKTPGSADAGTRWMCSYNGHMDVGCGLAYDEETGVLKVDLTAAAVDGLIWNTDNCTLDWLPGCGMQIAPDPATGDDSFTVDLDSLAGDNGDTALVVHDIVAPAQCKSLAVDLDVDATDTYYVDKITGFGYVAGKIRLSYDRRLITDQWNRAGLLINQIIGPSSSSYYEVNQCSDCCTVSALEVECTKSGSGGSIPYSVDFTATPSGGLAPYTYYWDFDDGSDSTDQNPTHIYTEDGTYNPYVIVTDSCGNVESCAPGTITVNSPPPPSSTCILATTIPRTLGTTYTATIAAGSVGTPTEHWWYYDPVASFGGVDTIVKIVFPDTSTCPGALTCCQGFPLTTFCLSYRTALVVGENCGLGGEGFITDWSAGCVTGPNVTASTGTGFFVRVQNPTASPVTYSFSVESGTC